MSKFDQNTIEELTGYSVEEIVRMYEDYENYAETVEKLADAEDTIAKILCSEYGSICQFCVFRDNDNAGCAKIDGSGAWCEHHAYWNGGRARAHWKKWNDVDECSSCGFGFIHNATNYFQDYRSLGTDIKLKYCPNCGKRIEID